MTDEIIYPTEETVYAIHDRVIQRDPAATPGVLQPGAVASALDNIEHGHFGSVPETIHEKAARLMHDLASNHEFVDGNKRTALATTASFYLRNGYYFDYDHSSIRTILKVLSTSERAIDMDALSEYFARQAIPLSEVDDPTLQDVVEEILERDDA